MDIKHNKKRKRSYSKNFVKSEKRQKIKRQSVKNNPIHVDLLPWKDVETPHLLEDAEGFYGLEEIEDVGIFREGDSVKFVLPTRSPYPACTNVEQFSVRDNSTDNSEEEFEGFSDDSPVNTTEVGKRFLKSRKVVENLAQREKKSRNDALAIQPSASSEGAFRVLLEQQEMEEIADISAWQSLDLSDDTLSALSKLGFAKPTPIQLAAIPEILAGHDVVGKASTGSGKTLAFVIPILENWLGNRDNFDTSHEVLTSRPHIALILSPTRELAHQITQHITSLCASLSAAPHVTTITGGLSVQKQQRLLAKSDIVVATPGRFWELLSSSSEIAASFRTIHFLVIDEADRLLTEGHFKEMEDILKAIDYQEPDVEAPCRFQRQTLVFSATLDRGLQQKLAGKGRQSLMNDKESMEYLLKKLNFREEKPKLVDVNPSSQMAERIKEGILECVGIEKDLYLYALLLYHRNQRALIFTNSIHAVRRLTPLLQSLNLPAQALHSQMIQKARMRSIERFSSATSIGSILVATDVAARGLDIKDVQLIIHYHVPRAADTYVHRSGRTARSELSGSSILLCAPEEVVATRRLISKVHAKIASPYKSNKSKYYIRSLDIDRRVVARLKPRADLARKITESNLAKEKKIHENDWIKNAAEELGVDYDSNEFEACELGRKSRGNGRKLKEKEARNISKSELGALRAELRQLLAERVNVGVSERYLASGMVDVDELLANKGDFLGNVDGLEKTDNEEN